MYHHHPVQQQQKQQQQQRQQQLLLFVPLTTAYSCSALGHKTLYNMMVTGLALIASYSPS